MGMMEAVSTCFKKYFTFSGRARRAEYWWFYLFNTIIGIVLGVIGVAVGTDILGNVYSLVVLVPGIAVTVRRLHDVNKSGFWLLAMFAPIVLMVIGGVMMASGDPSGSMMFYIGIALTVIIAIVLFVFTVMRGTNGPNRFGEDPITGSPEQVF